MRAQNTYIDEHFRVSLGNAIKFTKDRLVRNGSFDCGPSLRPVRCNVVVIT